MLTANIKVKKLTIISWKMKMLMLNSFFFKINKGEMYHINIVTDIQLLDRNKRYIIFTPLFIMSFMTKYTALFTTIKTQLMYHELK